VLLVPAVHGREASCRGRTGIETHYELDVKDIGEAFQHGQRRRRSTGLEPAAAGWVIPAASANSQAHMVEETARHCGHLDLLRERIDGRTCM